jgi:hypothetical protein
MIILLLETGKKYPIAEKLFQCTDWDRAEFRYPNPVSDWRESRAIACNVKQTGKTIVSYRGAQWLRGKVEWVHDDEPSTFSPCLIRVTWDGGVFE